MKTKKCIFCGKKYTPVKCHRYGKDFKKSKYCSQTCWKSAIGLRANLDRECPTCGKKFRARLQKGVYCSTKCAVKKKTGIFKNCIICDKEFYVQKFNVAKRKYCSKNCADKGQIKYSIPRKGIYNYFKINGFIKKCEECGYDTHREILSVHHKDFDRTNNSEENLEILCPNCHSIKHCSPLIVGGNTKKKFD